MNKSLTERKPSLTLPVLVASAPGSGAYLGLAILANAFVAYFVKQEHYIYLWDYSGCWIQYLDISDLLAKHPITALHSIISSVRHNDYNFLAEFPLVPFDWLFGTGRLTYILAITNVFVVPSAFLIAFVAQRVRFAERSNSSWILAAATILMLHPLWIPTLQGLPDAVGLVVIGGILLLHFAKPFDQQGWSYLLTTGFLLSLLVFLRRWYAYWVLAFFPALAISEGLAIYQRHGVAWREYIALARKAIVIGLTLVITLFGFALPFALKAVTTDYSDIYSAYRSTDSVFEQGLSLIAYFGWTTFFGGILGLLWLATRKETRSKAILLLVQSLIAFLLFARTQDFAHHHFLLIFPAIALGLGVIVINVATRITRKLWQCVALGTLLAVLLAGSSAVFVPKAAPISDRFGRLVPKVHWYPLVRNDFVALDNLLDRLDGLESQERGDIYVLASSAVLNDDVLRNYCVLRPRPRSFCDRISLVNHVDRRDGFPRQFLQAVYVVVASPIQYHLRPDDQRVIGVLATELLEGHGIGKSFERLSGEFALGKGTCVWPGEWRPDCYSANGVTVWVYARVRPFETADLDALAAEFAGFYPERKSMFMTRGSD